MSFILDALKKSENERHLQSGPSFADVKSAAPAARLPKLWIAIGLLLAINVIVLGSLLARRVNTIPAGAPAASVPARIASASSPTTTHSAPPASLPAPLPAAAAPPEPVVGQETDPPPAPEPRLDRPVTDSYASEDSLPTMNDVIAQGQATLPDLHLDMHVYGEKPADRFVSINSHTLREGMLVQDGLRVERITRQGVVLNYRGLRFLLPRP